MNRKESIAHFRHNPNVSILIIGAGINGLGVFRDLALQGVDVLVVDRGDFCSETSATSSRMIHGGIRYLENGEFRLVREAVMERNRLLVNAPHYVKPLPTTIPIYRYFSGLLNAPLKFLGRLTKPAERGALVIKAGLMMYDRYTASQQDASGVPQHTFRRRSEALAAFPDFNPDLKFAATYYDASMRDAERLAIEVMLDGLDANAQAHALNYVAAVDAEKDVVVLEDRLNGERFSVRPQIVINAAGPWIDFANRNLGVTTRFIGGTKGSHIVLDHPELYAACRGNEIFFENEDGRIVLIYPLANRVIVGTTDITIDDPDEATITDDEIAYFFKLVKHVFPSIRLSADQIVFAFTGVRPLPATDAATTGQISRDHENRVIESGIRPYPIFNLIGGKWTSFRAFAEQVSDEALRRLGRWRRQDTINQPIGGGRDYPTAAREQALFVENTALKTGVPEARVAALFERYGTRAREFAMAIAAGPDAPLEHAPAFSRREIAHIAVRERVVHLDDLLRRRTLLALTGAVTLPLLHEVAPIVGDALDWDEAHRAAEIERAKTVFETRNRARIATA